MTTMSKDTSETTQLTQDQAWADIIERSKCKDYKEVVQQYSKSASRYEESLQVLGYPGPRLIAEATVTLLGDNCGSHILDIGAGTGLVGIELAQKGYKNLDAVDASDAMLEEARKKKIYHQVICHSVGESLIPLEDNSYDMVITCGAFGHNFMPFDGLDEAVRLTRPGGFVINAEKIHLDASYNKEFESHMAKFQEQKNWRQISKTHIPGFVGDNDGYLYIHSVM